MNLGITFPSQKRPYSKKTKQWRKDCTDAGESYALWRDSGLRKSNYNKRVNYNLYSDILDQNDIEKTCNPLGILGLNAPAKMQNYPICNPKIDVLVGESIKRKFDWKVNVVNPDAISKKEEELKEAFTQLMTSHLQEEVDEKKQQEDLRKFQQFRNYEYQDLRERRATHVLKYLHHQQRLEKKFADGMKDALISAEEIYQADIVVGEPILRKLNPLNVYCVRSGESNLIEDSDIILITGYHSPGQIIDEYNDELTPSDIDSIETGFDKRPTSALGIDIGRKPDLQLRTDESIDLAILKNDNLNYGQGIDTFGNIRVTKVYWRSLRKMLKVKSYDQFGDVQYDLQDENYKIDITKGEEATELWIGEWWEAHKIGGGLNGTDSNDRAIYVKMQPRPVQFRSMENPSKCHPGIVGTIYNTNDNQGVSLMDRMKPYQYLYNVLAYNSELSVAKNYGKIMRLNLADIPENWQIDQWLSFAQGMNVAVYDSFKEGQKGAAQGKLAGSMNQNSPVIDMEMGNTIQLYMNMMAFIKQQMGEISGVNDQRLGQIETREAVNNVERSLSQTSAITEYWFTEHEYVKLRVLEVLLETAKFAWRGKSKKFQYIGDDGAQILFELDGDEFNECEYGLQITSGPVTQELLGVMKSSAQAALQAGILNFSQLLDIYSTDSLSSIRRKLENAEQDKMEREQQIEQNKKDMQTEGLNHQMMEADKQRNFTREEWDRTDAIEAAKLENNLEIERLRQDNVESKSFQNPNEVDPVSIEQLKQQADKIKRDWLLKQQELDEKIRHNKVTEGLKEKDIKIKKTTKSATKK